MKKTLLTALVAAVAGGLAAYGIVNYSSSNHNDTTYLPADTSASYRTVNLSLTDYPDFTYAAETCVDAVVYVQVTVKTRQNQVMDPFFQFFFGDGRSNPKEYEQQGSGSGVIIRSDGYIVTNNHVVAGASKVEVTLNNNKKFEAQVIGTDSATDLALIKIDAQGLPTVPLGNSDALRLGEWVLAIGSPYNLRSTITAGIVSAKGRSMPSDGEFKIESFIQTDAAVNPGNSGGALVNKAGELVGINTMIYSQTGSYSGYSFAVPVNIVKKIVGDLIDFGAVKRARLGVTMGTVDDKIASELKLSSPKGVYIDEVLKGSAADKAGMKHADVVIRIDESEIISAAALQEKVNSYHPGDKAEITIIREGKEKVLEVEFQGDALETGAKDVDGSVAFYGAKLRTASKETLQQLGIKQGVEIVSSGAGKVANAGGEDGFVILYVNDQPVSKPEDVVAIAAKSKRSVVVEGLDPSGRASVFAFAKD